MPATTQEKQDYVNVINAIWGVGVIPQNTIDNINDDVIEKSMWRLHRSVNAPRR